MVVRVCEAFVMSTTRGVVVDLATAQHLELLCLPLPFPKLM